MLKIARHSGTLSGTVNLPASKSMANRLLIMKALSHPSDDLQALPESHDVMLLDQALNGIHESFNFEDAGTPLRFYLAYMALRGLKVWIDGSERLKQRPLADLIEALESLGAKFEYAEETYQLPLRLTVAVDLSKEELSLNAEKSSQFLSALLLIAPYFKAGLKIRNTGETTSKPYVDMTVNMMRSADIEVGESVDGWKVSPGHYQIKEFSIEKDWSAASYFYALVALKKDAELLIPGLKKDSLQGDAILKDWFSRLGVQSHFDEKGLHIVHSGETELLPEFDFLHYPDLFPAVVACLAALRKNALLKGLANLRHKESDRIEAMRENLVQTGCKFVFLKEDEMTLDFEERITQRYQFKTCNDHRIAMACSIFVLENDVVFDHANVVGKSFPDYWEEFSSVLSQENL